MTLRILFIGSVDRDGTARQRARVLEELGHAVTALPSGSLCFGSPIRALKVFFNRTHRLVDWRGLNRKICRLIEQESWDLLWVDKGLTVRPQTLERMRERQAGIRLIHYSPDDMMNRRNQSRHYRAAIPLYDLHVTTKSYNVDELRAAGAGSVLFVPNAFDPETHRPVEISKEELARYGAEIGFVGVYERERWEMLLELARRGLAISVRGPGWPTAPANLPNLTIEAQWFVGSEYAKIVVATKINLCFLRRENRDLQTQRSVEIPACGGFMLAERTAEHADLFVEGKEAEFFDGMDELERKVRHYLNHPEQRKEIAQAGMRRCHVEDYSYHGQLRKVLTESGTVGLDHRAPILKETDPKTCCR